jgi:predicted metal-dependent hydrolase
MRPAATASDEDLARRAGELADRFVGGLRPLSIRWVPNQTTRWGSCTTSTGAIRISDRLRSVPAWVLDSVIVHELAHLEHADHSPAFHALVNRYPRNTDAGIYLDGFGQGLSARDNRAHERADELAECAVQDRLWPLASESTG